LPVRGRTRWPRSLVVGLLLLVVGVAALSASTPPKAPRPQASTSSVTYRNTPITPPPPTSTPLSTTVSATPPPALPLQPAAVDALSLAQMGQRQSYVATYAITQTTAHGIDPVSLTVAQVGKPKGGWPTEWYYRLTWADGAEFEMETEPGAVGGEIFRCGLQNPAGEWICYGPTSSSRLGGNYGHALVEVYEPMTQYGSLQGILTDPADTSSTSDFEGQRIQCVTNGSSQTWCLTPSGLFASFPAEDELDPFAVGLAGRLVSWSGRVSPERFVLPATPSTTISPGSVCVHGGPC
jgi:hypothetical protein